MDADRFQSPDSPHTARTRALLRLARATIAHSLTTGEVMAYHTSDPWLSAPAAVFVTLRVRAAAVFGEETWAAGDLRGCVGRIEADAPLYAAVQDAAIKAATADPRFRSVAAAELDNLWIEISVLSPLRRVHGSEEIAIGRDGLLITGDRHRGLLLPEVPLHFGWGAEEFLRALCHKAGLPEDAWPERARLYAFTTESFEE